MELPRLYKRRSTPPEIQSDHTITLTTVTESDDSMADLQSWRTIPELQSWRTIPELQSSRTIALTQSDRSISIKQDYDAYSKIVVASPHAPYRGIQEETDLKRRQLVVKQLKLMGPIILTHFLDYLPSLVGVMLVGHLDSPDTEIFVNAVTMSSMFTTLTSLSIGYGLCSALDTLSSQAYGAGQHKKIGVYLQTAIIVVFGVCLVPVCLLNWHVETFLLLAGQDVQVAKLAGEFSRYTVWGTPFLFFYEMMVKLLQAQNVVGPLVWVGIVGNTVEAGVGFYLSYHTTLGFHGAAVARVVGAIVLPSMLMVYVWWSGSYTSWWSGWNVRTAWKQVGVFVRLGVPGLLMLAMEWWAYEIVTVMAGVLPNAVMSVTTHVVLLNVVTLLYKVYQGIASSGKILVGNALGANMPERAQFTTRLTLKMVMAVSTVFALMVLLLRHEIPKAFTSDDDVMGLAGNALLVIVPYCVIDATYCAMQGIYCGMGRQQLAASTNAVAFYVVGLPVAATLAFHFHVGVEGLWLGFGSGTLVALTMCSAALYQTSWREMADQAQIRSSQ